MRVFWKIIIPILIIITILTSHLIFIQIINTEPEEELTTQYVNEFKTPNTIVYGKTMEDVILNIEIYSLQYLNDERISANIPVLIQDDTLNYIAKKHSENMAIYNYCEHLDIYGKYPVDRARDLGFNTRKIYNGTTYDGVGENLCAMPHGDVVGFGKIEIYDSDKIASSMIKCLMDSPEHKKNILNEVYSHVGIGVAYGNGYYYLTQDFW